MEFYEVLDRVTALLQTRGRVSYGALKRQFELDDAYLDDLKIELVEVQQVAVDQGSKMLVWTGEPHTAATPTRAEEPAPLSYTPQHLADKILTARSALEGERKQVTVLFADVAGFSTLSEQLEPEAIHMLMDGCFAILTQQVHYYEGTINQYTGDGIMALFGAPITHEDHAVRAVHAALAIQEALRDYSSTVHQRWHVPFRMRIGLNTGLVVVGRIGDDLRMDYTAQGDTTNLAARMQQMAPPGAIWAAEATYRLACEVFEWMAEGQLPVKGKADPVAVYELRGHRASPSRFDPVVRRGLTPLTGRDPELARLLTAWRQTQHGQGRVVSLVGRAGYGKSRLLYEFTQQLMQEEARCIEGTCFTYGENISYLPFLQVVRACCGLVEGVPESEMKRQIGERLTALEIDQGAARPICTTSCRLPWRMRCSRR